MRKKQNTVFDKAFRLCTAILMLMFSAFGCGGEHEDYVSEREGRFIDSAVQGLSYISGSRTDITDENGTFFYEKGKDVTFRLGNIVLGSATTVLELDIKTQELAPDILTLTPRDLVSAAESDRDPQVTNILRFLQTLDDDANPDNGIMLSESVRQKAEKYSTEVDFSLSTDKFEEKIQTVVNDLLGKERELISAVRAQNHFIRTKLQEILDKAVSENEVPGVALVAEVPCEGEDCADGAMDGVTYSDGKFTWKLTSGYSNLETQTPMTADTRFRVASLTKTFVAMTVMQMVEEGKITLDDSIEQWFPGLIPNGENINIRQVVNHSSGLYNFYEVPSDWFFDFLFLRQDKWDPLDLIELAVEEGPTFAPGTDWHYSNTNYVLLGMLIEKVTGNKWEDEIRNRFINKYGLSDTIVPETGESNLEGPYVQNPTEGKYAHGYIDLYDVTGAMYGSKNKGLEDASTREPSAASSSACMISSPENLCLWIRLIGEGRLFGEGYDFVNDTGVDPELYFPMNEATDCGPNIYKNLANNMLIASGNFLGYDVGIVYDPNHGIPIATCANRTLRSEDGQIKDIVIFDAIEILGAGLPTAEKRSADSEEI
jgi:CubicO group peptidase (beta-lactamase class C family)